MPIVAILHYGALGLTATALLLSTYVLAATPPVLAPALGERGRRRRLALAAGGLFSMCEPAIRKIAGWIARIELSKQRAQLEDLLKASGYALGATPDELMAMMALAALGGGLFALLITGVTTLSGATWIPLAIVGAASAPYFQYRESTKVRQKSINRGLPPAIDLVALCMGAGADFPSSIRFVISEIVNELDPTREEFSHILQHLEVGHTRSYALNAFADRVPTDAVRDFVAAVVQAEEKGTPLADVLVIQARMLRMRRTVSAEEAAARAAVMLIGPLMLMLGAILVILFGPFLINGLGF